MKDERNHYGTLDKSVSEQWIRIVDANYILCEKSWTRTCIAELGFMAGGSQTKYRCIWKF